MHTAYPSACAQINLKNLDYNFRTVKRLVGDKVKVLVPVKSDAYGHGILPVSKRLEALGADYLGVARIDEGIALREAGIAIPILILNTVLENELEPILDYGLTQTICTKGLAQRLNRQARKRNLAASCHIKVDTGMGRIGVRYEDAYGFIKDLFKLSNLKIEGVFTHFPCADNNPRFTLRQIQLFNALTQRLEEEGMRIPLRHASNSLGVINYPESHFNMVRPGLMVYGLYPKEGLSLKLKPLLSLETRIAYLKTVSKGSGIGYGHTYIARKEMRIATLPVGYGDGYPRSLSNKAYCLIAGKPARITGRICMDQMMVDVTKIGRAKIGQTAVLIGKQAGRLVSVEHLARLAGTIPYEIACSIGSRVKRIYIE
jgi:alanine racemase